MSRSLPIVHMPVPNPLVRFAALVNKPTPDPDVVHGLGDWQAVEVFHTLPADWPADDPTLSGSLGGMIAVRGQGLYTGVDPNAIVTPRALSNGATLVWRALWLYDASAPALAGTCPSPVCPPCPVTPPSAGCGGGGSGGGLLFVLGLAAGAGSALAYARWRR